MHDDRLLVEERLERVLRERLRPAVHALAVPFEVAAWHVPPASDGHVGEPVPASEALKQAFSPAAVGDAWGAPWGTTWFRLRGRVPPAWAGREVEAVVDLGFAGTGPGFQAEGLVYATRRGADQGAQPAERLACRLPPGAAGRRRSSSTSRRRPTRRHRAAPASTPLGDRLTAGDEPLYRLRAARPRRPRRRGLGAGRRTSRCSAQLMRELPPTSRAAGEILRALERALDALDLARRRRHRRGRPRRAGRRAGRPGPRQRPPDLAPSGTPTSTRPGCGRCARRSARCARTVRQRDRADGRRTRTSSSPARRPSSTPGSRSTSPSCSQRIQRGGRRRASSCRSAACGSSPTPTCPAARRWPGSSCTASGSSSSEFGVETEEVWLPDSFGYSAALPQIVAAGRARAGSSPRRSPGTRPTGSRTTPSGGRASTAPGSSPTSRRSTPTTPSCPAASWPTPARNFAEKGAGRRVAGAVRLRRRRRRPDPGDAGRARAAPRDLEGSPTGRRSSRPPTFFARGRGRVPGRRRCGSGELYLELHRGTYTTPGPDQAGQPAQRAPAARGRAVGGHRGRRGRARTTRTTSCDRLWKTVLLHQFHDILPGSLDRLGAPRGRARRTPASPTELEAIIADALSARSPAPGGRRDRLQRGAARARTASPALGVGAPATPAERRRRSTVDADGDGCVLDNGLLRVDRRRPRAAHLGRTTSPPTARSSRRARAGNLLQLHRDTPNHWDAWDIDAHYRDTVTDLDERGRRRRGRGGRRRAAVRVVRRFGGSTVTQTLTLRAGAPAARHRHRGRLARAAEVAQGSRSRSTCTPTASAVRDPVRARAPADPHQHLLGRGPVRDLRAPLGARRRARLRRRGRQRLDLRPRRHPHRRATTAARRPRCGCRCCAPRASPTRRPTRAVHAFRYAARGRAPTIADADRARATGSTCRCAGAGRQRPSRRSSRSTTRPWSSRRSSSPTTGRGDVVVRLYEARGGRAPRDCPPAVPVAGVVETDLLERPTGEIRAEDLMFRPFQILTLRFSLLG